MLWLNKTRWLEIFAKKDINILVKSVKKLNRLDLELWLIYEYTEVILSGSDIHDGKCEFRVFSHCRCHPRFKPKFESLGPFIKHLRAISLNGSLINVRDLEGPLLTDDTT